MTPLETRLAEALAAMEGAEAFIGVMFGDKDGGLPQQIATPLGVQVRISAIANNLVIAVDGLRRTAAQEANVQGGEWYDALLEAVGTVINENFHDDRPNEPKGVTDSIKQLCEAVRNAPAAHPTPALASGEVTDAMVKAALPWLQNLSIMRQRDREEAVRNALEAATRARQGERKVVIRKHRPQPFDLEPDAPNAADAEAYRAVSVVDAIECLRAYRGDDEPDPKMAMLAALQSIGAVIPTAAPVPVDPIDPRDKKIMGLYEKFRVTRTDGSSGPGCKHEHCEYFVLDLTHDPHAYAALYSYADSCRDDFPMLADDLMDRTKDMPKPKPWPADEGEKK